MHCVRPQVLLPQEPHLFAQALVDTSHTQRGGEELACIWTIDLSHSHNHKIQPFDLGQIFLSLQFPFCQVRPRLQFISFLAWNTVWLIDHACAKFDEASDLALRGFAAHSQGEAVRAEFVDFLFLGEACFAAAVEDVVELCPAFAIEYPGK